jgi:electron transfer flavoprotein alpha subunit
MKKIVIDYEKCSLCSKCIEICPFSAIEFVDGKIEINSACKMCKICVKNCPDKAMSLVDGQRKMIDKNQWNGFLVYVEHFDGNIHPVTFELIGKAKELADKIGHSVSCIFIGNDIYDKAKELLNYGVNKVYVYDHIKFKYYRADIYANAFEDCIQKNRPSVVLVGATSIGRSLAPRLSVRFRTGLTADCTSLEIRDNTDLVQIRPAFGGNIMAQIITPYTRPQFATVRYKIMDKAECIANPKGTIEICNIHSSKLKSRIKILDTVPKEKLPSISEADVLIAGGRGLKSKKDLALLEELADLLGGQVAVTRPLVEAGWAHYTQQIGLSGRTVKPKLIITCGISGAIQFTACMDGAEHIFAINIDKNAQIFNVAHYGVVGDLYQIVPELINKIKKGEELPCGIIK